MRIVYFTESLFPHVDGVSRTLARLFATLEASGLDFHVFSPFQPGSEVSWSDRVTLVRSIPFPLYPDYRISLPPSRRVIRHLEAAPPDLIHIVSPTPMAYWAQRLAGRMEVPVVASFHTHFVAYFRHYGVSRFESQGWELLRRFYRRCSRVYAPTQAIAEELRSQRIARVELWSRGVDLCAFSPEHRSDTLRRDVAAGPDRPLLLLVSRLVKEKDLAILVGADQILRERGITYSLVLVGDGPMRPELERALPEATFTGHREGAELARWYASADLFVFPSTTETLGNVVLEAQASGLPAVVVDRGGPQELIAHGHNGFVARANDPVDIADHLERLLVNPELRARMGTAARTSASTRDWDQINGALLESYREVVEGSRRKGREPAR